MIKNYALLIVMQVILIFPLSQNAYPSRSQSAVSPDSSLDGDVLSIELKRDISIYDLIRKSGYNIDDKDVVPFLTAFSKLNEEVKSISRLKKGTVVNLPLKYLIKVRHDRPKSHEKAEAPPPVKRKLKKAAREKKERQSVTVQKNSGASRDIIIRNIVKLSHALNGNGSVETNGFKLLTVTERSEISFDTSFFPVVKMDGERIIVLDYSGILSEEIKDLIEVSWPEYRIVSNRGAIELKSIIGTLLESMGYHIYRDKRIRIGGRTQVEYLADFLIFKRDGELLDSTISLIGIIGMYEYETPDELIRWLGENGVHVIELAHNEQTRTYDKQAELITIDSDHNYQEFSEKILTHLGFPYSRDEVINLSPRKEFSFRMRADLSIRQGRKTKLIQFAGISDYEERYARKRGFDIVSIKTWDDRSAIVNKILQLLSLRHHTSKKNIAQSVNPGKVKYRLLSPGVFVHSSNGPVFFTDSKLDPDLLRRLVDQRIKVITF